MARPANADSERTRRQILEVAIRQFGRDGFGAATLRKIAADAGISFATVHHYFGTKSGLFAACVEAAYQQLDTVGLEVIAIAATEPVTTRVARAVRHAFRAASRDRDRSRFLLRAFVFEDPDLGGELIKRRRAAFLDGTLTAFARDREHADELLVRFIGLGMLITRFAAASPLETEALSDGAFDPGRVVEDYLVEIAEKTLSTTLFSVQPS
jgi:AcrR family transcriptional regulator